MNTIGIIAEYNPFHNGHAYQIRKVRELTGAAHVVVAMSGDFVQRGAPALIDKYTRAHMALCGGADLVVELPVLWATASAEDFAMAGVTLLEKLGCVDGICFGAETDDLPLLSSIAEILVQEPEAYRTALSLHLKNGKNFPSARAAALAEYFSETSDFNLHDVLVSPNNILAIEYLKALKRRGASLTPCLIRREGAGYHEGNSELKAQSDTARVIKTDKAAADVDIPASASGIRSLLLGQTPPFDFSPLANAMPAEAFALLTDYAKRFPLMDADAFSSILSYLLLSLSCDSYSSFADISPDIANRIEKLRYRFSSFTDFCQQCNSRDVTYTRISRALTHILLNLMAEDYVRGKSIDYIPYLRILGLKKSAAAIRQDASVPFISKLADADSLLHADARWMLNKDIFASDLYSRVRLLQAEPKLITKDFFKNEYQKSPVII
jgi:predicted nucleotidyltransferase